MTASSTSAPSAAPASAVPLRGAAVTASVLVWLATAGPLLMALAVPTFGASQRTSTAQIGMRLVGAGALATVVGFLLAGVAVIVWLRRARRNAEALSTARHRLPAGWAVGAWFVPVGSLVLPLVVVLDVLRATSPGRSAGLPYVWWAGWIAAGFLVPWSYSAVTLTSPDPRLVPGILGAILVVELVATAFAAACFTRLALQVAADQDALIRSLPA